MEVTDLKNMLFLLGIEKNWRYEWLKDYYLDHLMNSMNT